MAILDQQGAIVALNAAWKGKEPHLLHFLGEETAMGTNYLQFCDEDKVHARPVGPAVAAGIRSVIAGKARFTEIYEARDGMGWFQIEAVGMQHDEARGVLIAHTPVGGRRLLHHLQAALGEAEFPAVRSPEGGGPETLRQQLGDASIHVSNVLRITIGKSVGTILHSLRDVLEDDRATAGTCYSTLRHSLLDLDKSLAVINVLLDILQTSAEQSRFGLSGSRSPSGASVSRLG